MNQFDNDLKKNTKNNLTTVRGGPIQLFHFRYDPDTAALS